jgi:hypothetical protein
VIYKILEAEADIVTLLSMTNTHHGWFWLENDDVMTKQFFLLLL